MDAETLRHVADNYMRVDRDSLGYPDRYIAHLRSRRDVPLRSVPPLTCGVVLLDETGNEISQEYDFIDPSVRRDGTFSVQYNIDDPETLATFCMKYELDRDGKVISEKKKRIWKGCTRRDGESDDEYSDRFMREVNENG